MLRILLLAVPWRVLVMLLPLTFLVLLGFGVFFLAIVFPLLEQVDVGAPLP